jgi:hypothetical protein
LTSISTARAGPPGFDNEGNGGNCGGDSAPGPGRAGVGGGRCGNADGATAAAARLVVEATGFAFAAVRFAFGTACLTLRAARFAPAALRLTTGAFFLAFRERAAGLAGAAERSGRLPPRLPPPLVFGERAMRHPHASAVSV